MANKMSLERAEEIAGTIAKAIDKWGRYAEVNYSKEQIYEAIGVLWKADSPDLAKQREELTKLRRQLAACMNREKARQPKPSHGSALEHVGDDEEVT
jgi:hypothetical protein